jgi:hypothetical protein
VSSTEERNATKINAGNVSLIFMRNLDESSFVFKLNASLRVHVSDHGASKTNGPTVGFVDEENALKWMLCTAAFSGPMQAAVVCINDCPFSSDSPTLLSVKKLNVIQICSDT